MGWLSTERPDWIEPGYNTGFRWAFRYARAHYDPDPENVARNAATDALEHAETHSDATRFDCLARFCSWCGKVACSKAKDMLKRERRYKRLSPAAEAMLAEDAQPSDDEVRTLDQALQMAAGRIPDKLLTIVRLRFRDNFSMDEIQGLLGISKTTAYDWLKEALRLLLELFGEEYA